MAVHTIHRPLINTQVLQAEHYEASADMLVFIKKSMYAVFIALLKACTRFLSEFFL